MHLLQPVSYTHLNLDTEKGNSVYRQAVENYDVANYYTQGNVTATSVELSLIHI